MIFILKSQKRAMFAFRCFIKEPPAYNVDWTMCVKSPVEVK